MPKCRIGVRPPVRMPLVQSIANDHSARINVVVATRKPDRPGFDQNGRIGLTLQIQS